VAGFTLRPLCVRLDEAAVRAMTPSIATRSDRDLYVRVFQQRGGEWHQCKTWLSRQLFF
jgi:hypothetical protein